MNWIHGLPLRTKKAGRNKILGLIVLSGITIFSVIGALSCEGDSITDGHTGLFVQGEVLDSLTLQPIDSVAISIFDTAVSSTQDYTDSLGAFKFGVLAGNGSRLFFRKPGYETKLVLANNNDTLTVLLATE